MITFCFHRSLLTAHVMRSHSLDRSHIQQYELCSTNQGYLLHTINYISQSQKWYMSLLYVLLNNIHSLSWSILINNTHSGSTPSTITKRICTYVFYNFRQNSFINRLLLGFVCIYLYSTKLIQYNSLFLRFKTTFRPGNHKPILQMPRLMHCDSSKQISRCVYAQRLANA